MFILVIRRAVKQLFSRVVQKKLVILLSGEYHFNMDVPEHNNIISAMAEYCLDENDDWKK
ncbi:MAG: hypothetical protein CMF45_07060 [Legionellales bacterium]|nr:hypothetical protein [Legionellales bacterium]|tara:strand:+ start:1029 stop:1208 length:180 start_codon:yes stop_codon:yes gene_type:complete